MALNEEKNNGIHYHSEDGSYMPALLGETARCTRVSCGQYIPTNQIVRDNIGLPHCSEECLWRHYNAIRIDEQILKAAEKMREDRSTGDRESFRAKRSQ